jgi:hypothetical protein
LITIVIYCPLCLITREYVMPERTSATIIAFPRLQAAAPSPLPAADDPHARLQRALEALELALADQRVAVARWRASLGELHGSVQGLGTSLTGLHDRLGTLAEGVDGLNRDARRLEAWADGVLAQEGGAGQP